MRCLNCFNEFDESFGMCPNCGVASVEMREPIDLMPGTVLGDRYLIGQSVGAGGFGIIYKAFDLKLENIVAVKEYYPSRIVTRAVGMKELIVSSKGSQEFEYRKGRFIAEARDMAKFGTHKNIPNVFEFFEENNTAYIVMELLEGTPLNQYMKTVDGAIDVDFAIHITNEVGNALTALHSEGIIHRDVAPDNIYLCSNKDMRVKLLDLGAAKLADVEEDVIDIVLKPGYSPVEQYVDDDKGNRKNIDARTDIYALGATLYMMLTGEKPDESTNRRINDIVKSPREINSNISENLSNAVMKAMAIDKHLRFKTVQEFLKAINGERKVISLHKEKRNRKIKQIGGVVAALAIVGIAALFLNNYYNQKRLEYELNPADITVWYIQDTNSGKDDAMNAIKEDFESKYEGVTVELKGIPSAEYKDAIEEAMNDGNMPTLFESTIVSDDVLKKCVSLEDILDTEPARACAFLDMYEKCYPDKKQMPLAIEFPVACVITNGPTFIDYSDDYFESLDSFPAGTNISIDKSQTYVISQNFSVDALGDEALFLDSNENKNPVIISSSVGMENIRKTISNYQYKFVYPKKNEVVCQFVNEWSISAGNKDEVAAASRLLSWMLGNKYQSDLLVNYGVSGEFPLCNETFSNLIETKETIYAPIREIKGSFTFVQFDPEKSIVE